MEQLLQKRKALKRKRQQQQNMFTTLRVREL